eukprot:Hpha_TRINITY_DN8807_c0_g1::TRINITY_DN8807_c0_g1_i2::g.141548::m.141548
MPLPCKTTAPDAVPGAVQRRFLLNVCSRVREHFALFIVLNCFVVAAAVYLYKCYLTEDQNLTVWISEQTLNPAMKTRLPSKYRMLNPTLLFVDYPVCRWLALDVGLRKIPFVTANFVSLVHPLFGIAAAAAMVKGAVPPEDLAPTPKKDVERVGFDPAPTPRRIAEGEPKKWLLWLAALLFTIRNTLDTLDGVMARARAAPGQKIATGVGFNGHVLDVVTDMFGVTIFLISIWVHYFRLRFRLERHNLPGLRWVVDRLVSPRGPGTGCVDALWCSRLLVLLGVAMPCITGLSWETTMLKMQNIFDHHTNNPQIMELERQPVVQLTYYAWSLTCSDSLFLYIIVALLLGYLHDFMCVLAVFGLMWLLVLSVVSLAVTHWLQVHPLLLSAIEDGVKLNSTG